ncbi:MAG: tRNA (adenosine(37)-N6)-dimethylallyltransferase MiaA [Actinobacteria bacterium]|nr:tRNA (adenosine(37)-N6)-dimethylallyltransferase MiaA [Actinomycetota bacterium]
MIRVAAIVGPTAVGKTEISLQIAEELSAEIVSVDSMQVYRGMDIGTAKPNADLRERVPHHLIDLFDPSHDVSVSEFQEHARASIDDIANRGRQPLLVGGSGLYYRAVVDDLSFPPREPDVRTRLEEEAEEIGAEALYARLEKMDPKAAMKIDPNNARRTIRALEVIEITGRPFSDNVSWDNYDSIYDLVAVGLSRSRDDLDARIAQRVEWMLEAGLVDEVRTVAPVMGRTARQALGYRQVLESEPSLLRDDIVTATRRFARRQESWFKADPRITWVDASRVDAVERVLDVLRGATR